MEQLRRELQSDLEAQLARAQVIRVPASDCVFPTFVLPTFYFLLAILEAQLARADELADVFRTPSYR